jgi:serine phosphatase RsbU (regulator of sigma subunit)
MICPHCSHDNPAELLTCPNCQARQYLAKLRVTLENVPSKTHYLLPRRYSIGRATENDIAIPDTSVSRQHAVIEYEADDFWIVDLDSTNGSLLNGLPFEHSKLTDADCIQLGSIVLSYYDESDTLLAPVAGLKTEQYVQRELTKLVENQETRASTRDVMLTMLDLMLSLTHAGTGLLYQYGDDGELALKCGRNSDGISLEKYPLGRDDWHLIKTALKEKSLKIEFSESGGNPPLVSDRDGRAWKQLVLPLETGRTDVARKAEIGKDGVTGFCLLTRVKRRQPWSDSRLELLHALGRQMAALLENDMLYREAEEKRQISTELSMAREIQERFQQTALPDIDGLEIAKYLKPCKTISGDYFDVICLSRTLVAIAIGDICGKGVPAALLSSTTLAAIRSQLEFTKSPDQIVRNLNRLFIKSTAESMFLTLFFGIIDMASGVLRYVNAGHPPPILIEPDLGMTELTGTTFALGIMEGEAEQEQTIKFVPGDTLFLYTDGVIDSRNPGKDVYGRSRLKLTIQNYIRTGSNRDSALPQFIHAINAAVDRFRHGCEEEDDTTILMVRRR